MQKAAANDDADDPIDGMATDRKRGRATPDRAEDQGGDADDKELDNLIEKKHSPCKRAKASNSKLNA